MTENKQFTFDRDTIAPNIKTPIVFKKGERLSIGEVLNLLNELHEENVELKNSLNEFEVFESNRIKGAVVTNDDFSVTLHNNNEADMVCNMINRFIRSVKND